MCSAVVSPCSRTRLSNTRNTWRLGQRSIWTWRRRLRRWSAFRVCPSPISKYRPSGSGRKFCARRSTGATHRQHSAASIARYVYFEEEVWISGQATQQRRGGACCGQSGEAARVAAPKLLMRVPLINRPTTFPMHGFGQLGPRNTPSVALGNSPPGYARGLFFFPRGKARRIAVNTCLSTLIYIEVKLQKTACV
jgi:hypothetical protein